MELHEYQRRGIAAALASAGRRWIFNDETGLGKTAQALGVARAIQTAASASVHGGAAAWGTCGYDVDPRCIVVCPALVRGNWAREIAKWWPEQQSYGVLDMGAGRKTVTKAKRFALAAAQACQVRIISYGMIGHLAAYGGTQADIIIFDECHLLQKLSSKQSQDARQLVRANPGAAVFGLTATLIPNQPPDAYTVLEILCPGRFGEPGGSGKKVNWKFLERYSNGTNSGWGWSFKGVNEENAAELRERISAMSSRTTKQEVAHLLPAFTVRVLEAGRGADRSKEVIAWTLEAAREASHVAILTHRRSVARSIAASLGPDTVCLTGEDTVQSREQKLAQLRDADSGILVATVHSIGRGIDLTFCTRALFAELYWRPETVVQGLGRFSRLSGTAPSLVDLLVIPGDISEKIAYVIQQKVEAINTVTEASASEEKLTGALASKTEEQLLAELRAAADSFNTDLTWVGDDDEG